MPQELRRIVSRCLAGDQSAMRELVDRYKDRVYGLCLRMIGHRQDAEDVAQESFVRVLRSLARWDAEREFEPWLLAIAGNRCRTFLAARRRRPVVASLVESPADRTVEQQAADHLTEEVERALTHLRPEYRQAFLLFHQQQLEYAEIAETLDCPLGTVKTWVHRARQALIEQLRRRGVLAEDRHAMRDI